MEMPPDAESQKATEGKVFQISFDPHLVLLETLELFSEADLTTDFMMFNGKV